LNLSKRKDFCSFVSTFLIYLQEKYAFEKAQKKEQNIGLSENY